MVAAGTRLAALEMIQSGTTTFTDMYYFEEEIAKAAKAAGLRGVLGETIIKFPAPDAKTPADGLARAESFIKTFVGDPLITPAIAPHSAYTLDKSVLLACRDLALKYKVPLITHLAETEDEVRIIREQSGLTPTAYLESIGFWAPRTVAAHGVWVTDEDVAILANAGVGVAHNPESNMKLAVARRRSRNIWRRRSRSGSARMARRAITISTCSKRCGRRRFCTSWSRTIRGWFPPRSHSRWRRWAAPECWDSIARSGRSRPASAPI
jgi:cytosine/adenosine deaminase-related metal-dependent hydrolase